MAFPLVPQPKKKPHLLAKRKAQASVRTTDAQERQKCHARSKGQCEVVELCGVVLIRCKHRATENHHLKSGIGRKNIGDSILSAHRLDCCARCHSEITGKVLVPVSKATADDAKTVQYERIRA